MESIVASRALQRDPIVAMLCYAFDWIAVICTKFGAEQLKVPYTSSYNDCCGRGETRRDSERKFPCQAQTAPNAMAKRTIPGAFRFTLR